MSAPVGPCKEYDASSKSAAEILREHSNMTMAPGRAAKHAVHGPGAADLATMKNHQQKKATGAQWVDPTAPPKVGLAALQSANADIICTASMNSVRTITIGELFKSRLVVPPFQRRYCWSPEQWQALLRDALAGGGHNIGRVMYYEQGREVASGRLRKVVSDGQQRCTTSLLMLAAIRDAADAVATEMAERVRQGGAPAEEGKEGDEGSSGAERSSSAAACQNRAEALVAKLNAVLVPDQAGMDRWMDATDSMASDSPTAASTMEGGTADGTECEGELMMMTAAAAVDALDDGATQVGDASVEDLTFTTLSPTFLDRPWFNAAILPAGARDRWSHVARASLNMAESSRRPMQVKQFYVERLEDLRRKWATVGRPRRAADPSADVEQEEAVVHSVHGSVRYLERLGSLASSVAGFRWLAFPLTKSDNEDGTGNPYLIFHRLAVKDAAQYAFYGVRESVSLQSADFIRNLILASFRDEADSIRMYHRYWLPIERAAARRTAELQARKSSVTGFKKQKREDYVMVLEMIVEAYLASVSQRDAEREVGSTADDEEASGLDANDRETEAKNEVKKKGPRPPMYLYNLFEELLTKRVAGLSEAEAAGTAEMGAETIALTKERLADTIRVEDVTQETLCELSEFALGFQLPVGAERGWRGVKD